MLNNILKKRISGRAGLIYFLGLIAMMAIAIALVFWVSSQTKKDIEKLAIPQKINYQKLPIKKNHIVFDKLPESFPSDIPIEKKTKVLENYSATTTGNGFQTTRRFVSKKTIQENFNLYEKYLKSNNWAIVSTIDEEKVKAITATKSDNQQMYITISQNSITGDVVVDITSVTKQ